MQAGEKLLKHGAFILAFDVLANACSSVRPLMRAEPSAPLACAHCRSWNSRVCMHIKISEHASLTSPTICLHMVSQHETIQPESSSSKGLAERLERCRHLFFCDAACLHRGGFGVQVPGHPLATGFLFSSVRALTLVRASSAHWLPFFQHNIALASRCDWPPVL